VKSTELTSIPFPPWETGTDRQRGRALWRYLRAKGLVARLHRRNGKLELLAGLSDVVSQDGWYYRRLKNEASVLDANASLVHAMSLAIRGEFVAAGAVYYVVMQRLGKYQDARLSKLLYPEKRRRSLAIARAKRKSVASDREVVIRDAEEKSAKADKKVPVKKLAAKLRISESSVRRIRRQLKKK
jgi:hypothetical protein